MIVALAGRRIDAPDTQTPRFPLENAAKVRERLSNFFVKHNATALVCSGACGADLLALDVAGKLEMRRRMVLPFECDRFRETSVIDRPGDWGTLFDRIFAEVEAAGDLVILHGTDNRNTAYTATNKVIIEEALALAQPAIYDKITVASASDSDRVIAVVVWDMTPRSSDDVTNAFIEEAKEHGLQVEEIATK